MTPVHLQSLYGIKPDLAQRWVAPLLRAMQLAELVTPYTEAMIFNIGYVQGADTMFLAHQSLPSYRLRRVTNSEWTLSMTPFVTEPFDETGHKPAVSLTLSDLTAGTGRTVTASAPASRSAARCSRVSPCSARTARVGALTRVAA